MAGTYTLVQYQALVEAIAIGALEVEYDGKRVKYRSLANMLELKRSIERDLGLEPGTSKNRASYPAYDSGVN